jgi:hypothetical protein
MPPYACRRMRVGTEHAGGRILLVMSTSRHMTAHPQGSPRMPPLQVVAAACIDAVCIGATQRAPGQRSVQHSVHRCDTGATQRASAQPRCNAACIGRTLRASVRHWCDTACIGATQRASVQHLCNTACIDATSVQHLCNTACIGATQRAAQRESVRHTDLPAGATGSSVACHVTRR